ncbi:cytochrome P450 [Actinomadura barringtoniae]|uniref:Cytochrome P450 n=1 Tax=Actinomadura barringtoniae TaxID=1427535 RepID=A0A939PDY7_9ACTN|nr:cytochrome P450 [Actinomadura barringtoniae]MBO2450845.1 cytochrome P450 [Actinomadura barringtoniae]
MADFERSRLELDPRFGSVRRAAPVTRVRLVGGGEGWLVTGWEEARRVLADPVFSRALAVGRSAGARRETFIADMDPPEHTRVRRHAVTAFTHRRVRAMRPRIVEVVDRLVGVMVAGGAPADLVEGLCLPLPVVIICELLGVPEGDRRRFKEWSDAFLSVSAYSAEQVRDAHQSLDAYLAELIARRRAEPADDLLSALVRVTGQEGGLTEDELINLGVGLLIAGYETTASQLTNLSFTLLTHRELWERLVSEPGLLPVAIEELLRYVPLGSDTGMPRVAARDVELGGARIRAGETVVVARPAANRDEAVFGDAESIVIDRGDNPHLAFGHGIHHCLGAHLARLELQVAIGALLARFPALRLAVPESALQWKVGLSVRGLHGLPVTWTSDGS